MEFKISGGVLWLVLVYGGLGLVAYQAFDTPFINPWFFVLPFVHHIWQFMMNWGSIGSRGGLNKGMMFVDEGDVSGTVVGPAEDFPGGKVGYPVAFKDPYIPKTKKKKGLEKNFYEQISGTTMMWIVDNPDLFEIKTGVRSGCPEGSMKYHNRIDGRKVRDANSYLREKIDHLSEHLARVQRELRNHKLALDRVAGTQAKELLAAAEKVGQVRDTAGAQIMFLGRGTGGSGGGKLDLDGEK